MRISSKAMFDQQMAMLSKQYQRIGQLQTQIASGKKIESGSDNPVLSSRIRATEDQITKLKSYENNQVLAKNRADLFGSTIGANLEQLKHIKELMGKVASDTLNDSERLAIGSELEGSLAALLSIANTKDSNGEYIFSGFNTARQPYVKVNGHYEYQGTDDVGLIEVAPEAQFAFFESGNKIFGDLKNGNGVFTVTGGPAVNTGSGVAASGQVVDKTQYVADTYTISFVTNSSGKLAYQVTGAASGQVFPPPPANLPADAIEFVPGAAIQFNGVSIPVMGQPNSGDQFTVAPSTKQNMFETISGLIAALKNPTSSASDLAKFKQVLSQTQASYDQIYSHMVNVQSSMGSRASQLDSAVSNNDNVMMQQAIIWSSLSSADLAQVASDLMQTMTSLQSAQQAYVKIQDLFQQLLKL